MYFPEPKSSSSIGIVRFLFSLVLLQGTMSAHGSDDLREASAIQPQSTVPPVSTEPPQDVPLPPSSPLVQMEGGVEDESDRRRMLSSDQLALGTSGTSFSRLTPSFIQNFLQREVDANEDNTRELRHVCISRFFTESVNVLSENIARNREKLAALAALGAIGLLPFTLALASSEADALKNASYYVNFWTLLACVVGITTPICPYFLPQAILMGFACHYARLYHDHSYPHDRNVNIGVTGVFTALHLMATGILAAVVLRPV